MRGLIKRIVIMLLRLVAKVHLRVGRYYDKVIGGVQFEKVSSVGAKLSVEGKGILMDGQKMVVGSHVFIGRNFFIRAAGGVTIGDYTHISRNVTIHTVNHNMHGSLLPYDREDIKKPVMIGDYVWIGMNVNILPGVKIGNGAVVGMGTTVSKDIESNSIVVGPAQRVVGRRSDEKTEILVKGGFFLK